MKWKFSPKGVFPMVESSADRLGWSSVRKAGSRADADGRPVGRVFLRAVSLH